MDNQSSDPLTSTDDSAVSNFPEPQLQALNPTPPSSQTADAVVPVTLSETADHELIFSSSNHDESGNSVQFGPEDSPRVPEATADDDIQLSSQVEKLASETQVVAETTASNVANIPALDGSLAVEPAPLVVANDSSNSPISLSSMAATTGDDLTRPDMTGEPTIPEVVSTPNFDPVVAPQTPPTTVDSAQVEPTVMPTGL